MRRPPLTGAASAAAMVILLVTDPATADEALNSLPLQRGYYVNAETPCGAASAATLALVRRDGIGFQQVVDRFKRIEKIGPTTFRVTADQINNNGAVDNTSVSEYEITGPSSYRHKNDFGTFTMRFCPQESLPDLWRTNDIRSVIK